MKRIAIFKTGTHTATTGQSLTATADFIRDVVAGYNPSNHEAPAVIGHPQDNHPAYGWVESLSFDEGKGILYANFKQLETQFIKLLKEGRFKKRSASFYPPNHPNNPTKGKPYLRHVGFLGAQPPAIKGLADFSEDKDCLTYEFSEPINNLTENNTMTMKQTDEVVQSIDFAEREAKLREREEAFEEREKAFQQQGLYDFTESLIQTGKIAPAERDSLISVMANGGNDDEMFSFSENGKPSERSGVDALKAILERLPPLINLSEIAASDPNKVKKPEHTSNVPSDEVLAQQIADFAEKRNLSYAEAVQQFNGAV